MAKAKEELITEEKAEKIVEEKTAGPKAEKKTTATAKAGKRSKKAVEAEAEAEAKVERKQKKAEKVDEKPEKPKATPKNMERIHSKKWRAAQAKIDLEKLYDLPEAIALVQTLSTTKFDASMEMHINLGIDPRQSDQLVRTNAALPAGSGKTVRVAVVADEKNAATAKAAGADRVDSDKLLAEIEKGKFDFDVLLTTPAQMPTLAKFAKVLGPKGLMPTPKAGSVTDDLEIAIKAIKAGRAELKNDSAGIVHVTFGKVSFKANDLEANAKAILNALQKSRPTTLKGTFVTGVTISATMTPGVKVDVAAALKDSRE